MKNETASQSFTLRNSARFQGAKKQLIETILEASAKVSAIRRSPEAPELKEAYHQLIQDYSKDRGRDLYYPFLGSGLGSGPFVELVDGSVKYDMITGIGINFFGHSHPDLISEVIDAAPADIMQGNLEPGIEMKEVVRAILAQVGKGSRLSHGWLMCSGTMVNEVALKIIRQKKSPATKVMAFKNCFAGRSTAMQEITDNPSNRQGQPLYGEVEYLPFYDPKLGLQGSIDATIGVMTELLERFPGKFTTLMMELIQGEGGFRAAPREFYIRIFEEAKKAGLAIWADEVQTFGRTGEFFAYQKFELNEYIDVVTIGKMLQACLVLFTDEYAPKAGLVAGTFAGSTVALRTARKIIEMLANGGYLGKDGKIEKLSNRFAQRLKEMEEGPCKGMIRERRTIGGMIAFVPFDGTMEDIKSVLIRLYDLGVVAFYCGHGPLLIRMLPPLPAMTEAHVDEVCSVVQTALLDVAQLRKTKE